QNKHRSGRLVRTDSTHYWTPIKSMNRGKCVPSEKPMKTVRESAFKVVSPGNRGMFALRTLIALLIAIQLPLYAKNPRQHSSAPEHTKTKKIKQFSNWPAGASPQEIGKRVAERYLSFTYLNLRRNPPGKVIIYPETCTWYGALTFAKLAGDKDLSERLFRR